ncbi:MAG: hypothetical protein K0Q72_4387 [Armatimonadetes bacterium]|jgi:uncharacterized protein (TIGR02588 family)|nr:hypothetical protein [Armatimonadota bacterium]
MTGSSKRTDENDGRPARRKLAEWVTLSISSAIVFGLSGFLIMEGSRPESRFVTTTTRLRLDQVHKLKDTFVLPVEVRNDGSRTIRELAIQITAPGIDHEVTLDFLGERSSETIYAYLDKDPRTVKVEATPRSYLLD